MHNTIEEILVSEQEIAQICERLGKQVSEDYEGKDPLILGLLNGCIPFLADLTKKIEIPITFAYMDVSSYHGTVESSGDLIIKYDLQISVKDRNVIIVEDIVDTGRTLKTVVELLMHRGARTVEVVTLLDKPEGRVVHFEPKYVGKVIPKKFVVGYGLDYEEYYRNLPYVGVLKKEVYSK